MRTKKRVTSGRKNEDDAARILDTFLDFQAEGKLAEYIVHCGIRVEDIDAAGGDIPAAILYHYRKRDGSYDVSAVAHDLFRWPPIIARVKELKREHWGKDAAK